MARRTTALRAPARPCDAAPGGRSTRLPRLARPLLESVGGEDAAGDADAPPGRAPRALLSRRQGGRRGVHCRGRGDPGPVRLAGGDSDSQRTHAPRRRAGTGQPRGPGRDLTGRGRRLRRQNRPPGVVQPRGPAHRRGDSDSGPPGRAAPRGDDVPARRRAGDLARGVSPGPTARGRHDDARRGDRAVGARRSERPDAHQRHADPFGGGGTRIGRRHHAGSWRRSRSWSGSGRRSSEW